MYALALLARRGFTPCTPPSLVYWHIAERCGFQPRHENISDGNMYKISDESVLSATGEIGLAGTLLGRRLLPKQLPIRYVGANACFRPEVSSQGSGLYRVHQFSKVEMFAACMPDQSESIFTELQQAQLAPFEGLGLSGRLLEMPSSDLGAAAHRKQDVEAWLPASGEYGEVASLSMCGDYQSRRLNARVIVGDGTPRIFAHTLNGTACAVPRILCAILEQCQCEDGSVQIPHVLRPYLPDHVAMNVKPRK